MGRTKGLTPAGARLLNYAATHYQWMRVLSADERPVELKRVFAQQTIARLIEARYIKYRPAQIYVTGAGRKALKDYQRRNDERRKSDGAVYAVGQSSRSESSVG